MKISNSKKISKKVSVNLGVEKPSKSSTKKINSKIKKLSFKTMVIAVLLLMVGVGGGFLSFKILTKNDCFVLNGKDEITLQIGESYIDSKVKVVAFNKDVSTDIKIETNLKQNEDGSYFALEEGTYYIIYKSNHFKYNTLFKVQKIRLITFVEATESDEIENVQGGNN